MSFNKDDPTAAASLKGVGTPAVVKIHRTPREAETPGVDCSDCHNADKNYGTEGGSDWQYLYHRSWMTDGLLKGKNI